ncbi:MAG: hypothetical protein U0746_02260 [Gemmataceae bacterium]
MLSLIYQTLRAADGRYLTRDEQQRLLDSAGGLPARFDATEQIEAKEDRVIRSVLEQMRDKYPNFEHQHDRAWAKGYRDVQLVVRHAAQAMTFDDMSLLEDRVLIWLRTILAASNLTPAFVRETYQLLLDGFRHELTPQAFSLFEPYLSKCIQVTSDFPEPALPAV